MQFPLAVWMLGRCENELYELSAAIESAVQETADCLDRNSNPKIALALALGPFLQRAAVGQLLGGSA